MKEEIKQLYFKDPILAQELAEELGYTIVTAEKIDEGDRVLVDMEDEGKFEGTVLSVKGKKYRVKLDSGETAIVLKEDVTLLGIVPEADPELKKKITEWKDLSKKFISAESKVKSMFKDLGVKEKDIQLSLKAVAGQRARVDKLIFALEKSKSIPKPYKDTFEFLLSKVSKNLAKEAMDYFDKLKVDKAKVKEKLIQLEACALKAPIIAKLIPEFVKKFFSKILTKLKSIVKKNEPHIKKMEDLIKKVK